MDVRCCWTALLGRVSSVNICKCQQSGFHCDSWSGFDLEIVVMVSVVGVTHVFSYSFINLSLVWITKGICSLFPRFSSHRNIPLTSPKLLLMFLPWAPVYWNVFIFPREAYSHRCLDAWNSIWFCLNAAKDSLWMLLNVKYSRCDPKWSTMKGGIWIKHRTIASGGTPSAGGDPAFCIDQMGKMGLRGLLWW